MITIKFYCYSGKENLVDKLNGISLIETANGEFRNVLDIMNPVVDLILHEDFGQDDFVKARINYCYIQELERYYFVDKYELLKDIVRLYLRVDVLYTFKNYISYQKGFVYRNEENGMIMIPDERRGITNDVEIIEHTLTNTEPYPITFNPDLPQTPANARNFIVCVANENIDSNFIRSHSAHTIADSETGLPNVTTGNFIPNNLDVYFATLYDVSYILAYARQNSAFASNIASIVAVPFNFDDYMSQGAMPLKDFESGNIKILLSQQPDTYLQVRSPSKGGLTSGYLTNFSFIVPNSPDDFNDLEPYSLWELFIPYYGWINIPYNSLRGHELMIQYVINYLEGSATVFVIDITKQNTVFSSKVQLGVEVPKTISNIKEVQEKQISNGTSLGFSLLAGLVSVGAGIATMNPIGIAGGIVAGATTIGKGISNFVENDRMNLQKSQTSFGSPLSGVYSYQNVKLRQTRKKIRISVLDSSYVDFVSNNGLPVNKEYSIGSIFSSGYTELEITNFDSSSYINDNPLGILPLHEDLEDIRNKFRNGVIL